MSSENPLLALLQDPMMAMQFLGGMGQQQQPSTPTLPATLPDGEPVPPNRIMQALQDQEKGGRPC